MPKPRKKKSRSIGRVFHILFEDKKSARFYIQGYKKDKAYGDNIVLEPHEHTDPLHLVDDAKLIKSKNPKDEVWVVYDAESPRQRDVQREHAPAWQHAQDKGIRLAISSVSYEFWILLHHTYSTRAFRESNELEKFIQSNHDSDYGKSDANIYSKLKSLVETARKNAKRLEAANQKNASGEKAYEINPYTDFHKLLDAIDEFVKS